MDVDTPVLDVDGPAVDVVVATRTADELAVDAFVAVVVVLPTPYRTLRSVLR